MRFFSFLRKQMHLNQHSIGQRTGRPVQRFRPRLESLQGRDLPSTLTVLNTADNGPGSLRATIAAAQSGDTIHFDASLNGQEINLTSGELAIDKNLDIEGPGGAKNQGVRVVSITAARVFDIAAGANVTLGNLSSFFGTAYQGGNIFNAGTLTLRGCHIFAGEAQGAFFSGGVQVGPSADAMGGDIYTEGTLSVDNCIIDSGTALGNNSGGAALGAGIYQAGGAVVITHSQIGGDYRNVAAGTGPTGGGGIYVAAGTLEVSNCLLTDNTLLGGGSPEGPDQGGALYQAGGQVAVVNSTFSGNFINAGATAQGSAVFEAAGSLELTNDQYVGNVISGGDTAQGGAIYLAGGSLVATNCFFGGNFVSAGDAQGGAIYVANGDLTIQNCAFQFNAANPFGNPGVDQGVGGAIYIAGGSVCISHNTTFANDFALTSDPEVFGSFTIC
jgi:hypothetical protein